MNWLGGLTSSLLGMLYQLQVDQIVLNFMILSSIQP